MFKRLANRAKIALFAESNLQKKLVRPEILQIVGVPPRGRDFRKEAP